MWIGASGSMASARATTWRSASSGTARSECGAIPSRRFGSPAKRGLSRSIRSREAIQVVHEPALPGLGRAAAEPARHVQHRQMGQADAARPLRLQDRPGQLRRVGEGAPINLVMQVMELADRGVAGLEHLDVQLRCDRAQLVRADPLEKAVHHRAPGPERRLARLEALGEARHRPLERVAVQVRHAGQDDAGDALGARRRGADLDGGDVAAAIDLQPDRLGEAVRQQRGLRPEHRHG